MVKVGDIRTGGEHLGFALRPKAEKGFASLPWKRMMGKTSVSL